MAIRRIASVSRTYRHVNRYRQILTTLIRYGFDEAISRLRINQYLELGLQLVTRRRRSPVETLTTAERVRLVLEELGPTFIKLGQVLSTRPDVIPPDLATELAKLQQHVAPFPFAQVRSIMAAELHRPLEEVYARFDEQPIAAASIGQVHRAALRNGKEVVVKVQRPGIRARLEVDLEILLHLATLAERHLEGWRLYRPTRLVEEFARVLERELDFTSEAAHIERFAGQFRDDPTLYVPRVYRDVTTTRVLTLEYVDVLPVGDPEGLRRAGLNPRRIAERGLDLTLRQVFVHGFFHADPHPGNIFALPGDVVCLLDFGMMGRLDRQAREDFADLIYALASRDIPHTTTALLRLVERDDESEPDRRAIERDVAEFIDLNITEHLERLNFTHLLHDLLALLRRHQLRIPPDLVSMLKAAATVERLAARLNPELNVIAAAEPYVRRLKLDRMRPGRLLSDALASGEQLVNLAREIPGGLRDLLRLAKRGSLRIGFEHRGLDKFIETNERIANRLSFAVVVAALIVGSSLIVLSQIPPKWHEVPVIGLAGFLAAGVMGFVLLLAILRHGRL